MLNNQLKGQAFLQAYESLRGAGAITDIETKSATEALARLDLTQSIEAYDKPLKEVRSTLENARDRAR